MNTSHLDALTTFQQLELPSDLGELLKSIRMFSPLLQTLPNVVFFVKNLKAEYIFANQTLLQRLNLQHIHEIEGKTSESIFGSEWGRVYTQQDKAVLQNGLSIKNKLELHVYTSGDLGWCLTNKMPVYDSSGVIIGMMGVSIDIDTNQANKPSLNQRINKITLFIQNNLEQTIKMQELEHISGLSTMQIERYFKKLFQVTPSQYIQKVRVEKAIELLKENFSITEISSRCGYADHSAFTRQFKQVLGMPPSEFKQQYLKQDTHL